MAYARDELGATTWFLTRGADMRGTGLGAVPVRILAPEDDIGVYYDDDDETRLTPRVRAMAGTLGGEHRRLAAVEPQHLPRPIPPALEHRDRVHSPGEPGAPRSIETGFGLIQYH